jgi:hypothetical protein
MIAKYPRTRHIEGSRLQPGDADLSAVPFREIAAKHLVVEEKIDGANCGVSFSAEGEPLLQSRGHFLRGGARERHFDLFKQWAHCHRAHLFAALGHRHVMYGEWVFAKHTIYYDALPHYFLEFDVLDRETLAFLSTDARQALLAGLPVASVPVVHRGPVRRLDDLTALARSSLFKTPHWRARLEEACGEGEAGQWGSPERLVAETDASDLAEGLYIKHEEQGRVVGRYKWVRATFLDAVARAGGHWLDRPIVKNRLAEGVDIFSP